MGRCIRLSFLPAAVLLAILAGCSRRAPDKPLWSSADSAAIVREILDHRAMMDDFFRSSPHSPFAHDTSAHYTGIRWFPPSIDFYFRVRLHRFGDPETVIVLGTKGEERRQVKYGYFELPWNDKFHRLNAYRSAESGKGRDLAVWFTDSTTAKETYGVGRYLDVGEERDNPEFLYTVDFNKAYNPYCAYSSLYSCAVPRREDRLDIAVRAGEMTYHP